MGTAISLLLNWLFVKNPAVVVSIAVIIIVCVILSKLINLKEIVRQSINGIKVMLESSNLLITTLSKKGCLTSENVLEIKAVVDRLAFEGIERLVKKLNPINQIERDTLLSFLEKILKNPGSTPISKIATDFTEPELDNIDSILVKLRSEAQPGSESEKQITAVQGMVNQLRIEKVSQKLRATILDLQKVVPPKQI